MNLYTIEQFVYGFLLSPYESIKKSNKSLVMLETLISENDLHSNTVNY